MNTETSLLDAAKAAASVIVGLSEQQAMPDPFYEAPLAQLRAAIAREEQAAREPQEWAKTAADDLRKACLLLTPCNKGAVDKVAAIIQKHARQSK